MFNKQDIIDYWNDAAKDYNNNFSIKTEYNKRIQHLFCNEFPKNVHTIFDCGTGNGEIGLTLVEKGYKIIAGDISLNMINEAIQNTKKLSHNIEYLRLEAETLPFKDNIFDAVVSNAMLYSVMNPGLVVKEWFRVLKPNGKVIYIDGNLNSAPKIIYKLEIFAMRIISKMLGESEPKYIELITSVWAKDVKRPEYDIFILTNIGFKNIKTIKHVNFRLFNIKHLLMTGWRYPLFFISAKK